MSDYACHKSQSASPVHITHTKLRRISAAPSRYPRQPRYPRNLENGLKAICRVEAKTRKPYETQTRVTAHRLVSSHIKSLAASAANPSRTPHPAPRNLEIFSNGACRGEADSRIPYETQPLGNCQLTHSIPHIYSLPHQRQYLHEPRITNHEISK